MTDAEAKAKLIETVMAGLEKAESIQSVDIKSDYYNVPGANGYVIAEPTGYRTMTISYKVPKSNDTSCSKCKLWKLRNEKISVGEELWASLGLFPYTYCPNCGRRLTEDK